MANKKTSRPRKNTRIKSKDKVARDGKPAASPTPAVSPPPSRRMIVPPSDLTKRLLDQGIHASPHISLRGLYNKGRCVFALCEYIRIHLDDNAISHKDKMFILKCLAEYYQDKDANFPKETTDRWFRPASIYCGPPPMGDNPPGVPPTPGHGGER